MITDVCKKVVQWQRNLIAWFSLHLVLNTGIFTARCYCRARLCHRILSATLFVCPSVTLRYVFHTGWNTSRPNSLRPWLWGTPNMGHLMQWEHPENLRLNWGGVTLQGRKPAISPKRCDTEPWLLLRTNRNSCTRFRLVPKSATLKSVPKE